ncbi:diacylglycerol kinase family protein [Chryseomicrobium palamuruense]|uniref:Diacylglycerol kinase family protein n=1 Tax=Chryseomicrobium palamuruense TaxID=682973 RepID=A0ABV8UXP7_9BACL
MRFVTSVRNAARGIRAALKSERHMRFHFFAAVVVLIIGWILKFSSIEWAILLIVIIGMMALELVNTALETLVDLVEPDQHPVAGKVKDIAAGACLVFAIGAAIIGFILFIPKLIDLLV